MKKAISILSLILMLVMSVSLSVSADEFKKPKTLTVFGDSITCGYNLDDYDYDYSRTKSCFTNIIADRYGIEANKGYINNAMTGLKSEEILRIMSEGNDYLLKDSDIVIVSAGANDIINAYADNILKVYRNNKKLFEDNGINTSEISTLAGAESALIRILVDPTKKELREKIVGECTDEPSEAAYKSMADEFIENLEETVKTVQDTGSKADIYIISPYDPLNGLDINNGIIDSINNTIKYITEKEKALANDNKYSVKLHIIDMSAAFDGAYDKYTFIKSLDIHPNKDGHALMAQLIINDIEGVAASDEESEAVKKDDKKNNDKAASKEGSENKIIEEFSPVESQSESSVIQRDPPYSPTIVYIIMGVALASVAAIVVHFYITHRKK